jgi:hypothetical protein
VPDISHHAFIEGKLHLLPNKLTSIQKLLAAIKVAKTNSQHLKTVTVCQRVKNKPHQLPPPAILIQSLTHLSMLCNIYS